MKTKTDPEGYYRQKGITIDELKAGARNKRTLLAWVRFGCVLLAIAFGYLAWNYHTALWVLPLVGSVAAFARVLIWDANNGARIRRLDCLGTLVSQEASFLKDGTSIPAVDSSAFLEPEHLYAYDLDIFGKSSLYNFLNRSQSEPGRSLLAAWLSGPADRGTILLRQEAAKELAADPDFIFDLNAIGKETPLQHKTVTRIKDWLLEDSNLYRAKIWNVVRWVYPVISFGLLGCYIASLIPSAIFGVCFLLFIVVSFSITSKASKDYAMLSGIVKEISLVSESVALIEKKSFSTSLNLELQKALIQPAKASVQIRQLDKLLGRFDVRLNAMGFIFINSFLLWDLHQMIGLNKWRDKNRGSVSGWIEALATTEALSSIALLHFNRPEWVFPGIEPTHFHFSATNLGHPLIPADKRVTNSFSTEGTGQIELITGSNMAGKSTFLRTIGVNVVLAMAGAPVCASACRVSSVRVVSSMRIADNLEDSTSTFYAELKKLKSIIDRVKAHEHVFILLDEILRGTNSRDRLAGSQALVRQLIRDKAVGIIATHDLELAHMEQTLPGHIRNYYFDVQFYGDQLGFDYKLREGVCTTKNAELLMKQIGIEFV